MSALFLKNTIVGRGTIEDGGLGRIEYIVKKRARRIIARWQGGVLHITLPFGITVRELELSIDRMRSRLLAMKPCMSLYEVGKTFDFGDFKVSIVSDSAYRGKCSIINPVAYEYEIRVASDLDLSTQVGALAVSNAMKRIAKHIAPAVLLPRARRLAVSVGSNPSAWSISSGRRVLGRCNSRGEIALSCMVVFLPQDLRDYIVYHELAHLKEMNHSAAFHRWCDLYCGGNERKLMAALKTFSFPVL